MQYIGAFQIGNPNGRGTMIFAGGTKYVGEFAMGLYHGQGTLYGPDGSILKSGVWKYGDLVVGQ